MTRLRSLLESCARWTGRRSIFASRTASEPASFQDDEQLRLGGYDQNYVVDGRGLRFAARARSSVSGRVLEVFITEPGLQFYTGNYLDSSVKGKGGRRYDRHSGFCLETQHFPDSPNHASFPTTVLKAGQSLQSTKIFRFSVG